MTNFIPVFPLNIIVFPGEALNLHIFEPRYKQLVKECFSDVKPFGIPGIINNQISELGTLVKVVELVKVYDSGEMDIRVKGVTVFRILEIIKRIPDKLYSGAIVHYPDVSKNGSKVLMEKILERLKEMHRLLKIAKPIITREHTPDAYDIAHHAGLSIEQEYELLGLTQEIQRQEYLKRHLDKVISVLTETEALKEKIKLNGHFKNPGSMDISL